MIGITDLEKMGVLSRGARKASEEYGGGEVRKRILLRDEPYLEEGRVAMIIHRLLSIINSKSFKEDSRGYAELYKMDLDENLNYFPDESISRELEKIGGYMESKY